MESERGSAAVETVLVAPALLLVVAVLIGGGRLTTSQAAVRAVAREAARVAVAASTPERAVEVASSRAAQVAVGYGLDASRLDVSVLPGSFERGGNVTVEVSYYVELSDLPSLGVIPSGTTVSSRHVEPIDLYGSR